MNEEAPISSTRWFAGYVCLMFVGTERKSLVSTALRARAKFVAPGNLIPHAIRINTTSPHIIRLTLNITTCITSANRTYPSPRVSKLTIHEQSIEVQRASLGRELPRRLVRRTSALVVNHHQRDRRIRRIGGVWAIIECSVAHLENALSSSRGGHVPVREGWVFAEAADCPLQSG